MKIAYAEDVQNLRQVVIRILKAAGHEVDAYQDGASIIHALSSKGYICDFVVTDNQMPKKTGMEVLRFIRSSPTFKLLPVIVLSADDDIQKEAEKLGAFFFSKTYHDLQGLPEIISGMATK